MDIPRSRWSRLLRGYQVLAVQCCTVILLFVLVNVLAWIVLRIEAERARHRLPSSWTALESRFGRDWASTLYPGWDQKDLEALYAEWQRVTFDYEPYTQFSVHPMRSTYTNVTDHGFRSNGAAAPWPPNPNELNVFVFGGSTAFGAMLPDAQTIPAALETILRDSGCGLAVHVYNFARPGYIGAQERALFEQLLLARAIPNVAVFIDGLNDSLWQGRDPQYTDQLRLLVSQINTERVSSRWYSRALELAASLPIIVATEEVRQRVWPTMPPGKRRTLPGPAETAAQIEWIVADKRIRDTVADTFGVKSLTVWQPSPTYHYDLSYHAFGEPLTRWGAPGPSLLEQSRAFYVQMDARRHDPDVEKGFLWLADMQTAKRENLYVDSLHYNAAFSKEIAGTIVKDLNRRGWIVCARNTPR